MLNAILVNENIGFKKLAWAGKQTQILKLLIYFVHALPQQVCLITHLFLKLIVVSAQINSNKKLNYGCFCYYNSTWKTMPDIIN
jgi:hypothetical protein